MSGYRPTYPSRGPECPTNVTCMDSRAPPGDLTGFYYIVLGNTKRGLQWQELKDFIRSKGVEVDHVEVYKLGAWVRINGKENFRKAWAHLNGAVFQNRCLSAANNEKGPLVIPNKHFHYVPTPTCPDASVTSSTISSSASAGTGRSWGSPAPSNVTMSSVTTAECISSPADYQDARVPSYPPQLNSCSTSYMQGECAQGYVPAGYAQGGFVEAGYGTSAMGQPEYPVTNTSLYNTGSTPYTTYQDAYAPESYGTDVNAAAESLQQLSAANEGPLRSTVEEVYRKVIISRLSLRLWTTPAEMHKIIRDKVSAAVEKDIINAQPNNASGTRPSRYSYSVIFRTPDAAREAVRKLDGLNLKDCRIKAKPAKEGVTDASFPSPPPAPEYMSKKSRSATSKDQEKREKRDQDKPIIADGSKDRKKKSKSA